MNKWYVHLAMWNLMPCSLRHGHRGRLGRLRFSPDEWLTASLLACTIPQKRKNYQWLWALLKLLAICEWLSSNIEAFLCFRSPRTSHIQFTYFLENIFTTERIRNKMYLKASWSYRGERKFLASFFFHSILMHKLLVNKIFPFFFCYFTFLARRLMIPPTGVENTPENESKI